MTASHRSPSSPRPGVPQPSRQPVGWGRMSPEQTSERERWEGASMKAAARGALVFLLLSCAGLSPTCVLSPGTYGGGAISYSSRSQCSTGPPGTRRHSDRHTQARGQCGGCCLCPGKHVGMCLLGVGGSAELGAVGVSGDDRQLCSPHRSMARRAHCYHAGCTEGHWYPFPLWGASCSCIWEGPGGSGHPMATATVIGSGGSVA